MTPQHEALRLLEEALKELESQKGSVLVGVQKLSRASELLAKEDINIWCAIQLAYPKYMRGLRNLAATILRISKTPDYARTTEGQAEMDKILESALSPGIKKEIHLTEEELNIKIDESGGGYNNIGFIEEKYADLARLKKGNDGTFYKANLLTHLSYVRRRAHEYASALYNQVKFSGTTANCFDILKSQIDDHLLDLNPTLAEQLMLAFKSASGAKQEEWSHSLTTCRRLLEGLADELYPASENNKTGRPLKKNQYVNRLWAFMDESIESDSNKDLAKSHVDFLGSWMEKVNKISNKGVHAEVSQIEAVKSVFHTYLVIGDLLGYLNRSSRQDATIDINNATLDEIESILGINRSIAKSIIKARVQYGEINREILSSISGIGPKILEKAVAEFKL